MGEDSDHEEDAPFVPFSLALLIDDTAPFSDEVDYNNGVLPQAELGYQLMIWSFRNTAARTNAPIGQRLEQTEKELIKLPSEVSLLRTTLTTSTTTIVARNEQDHRHVVSHAEQSSTPPGFQKMLNPKANNAPPQPFGCRPDHKPAQRKSRAPPPNQNVPRRSFANGVAGSKDKEFITGKGKPAKKASPFLFFTPDNSRVNSQG